MTPLQFYSAIAGYLDEAIHEQGYLGVIDHGQTFSALLGSGPPGLGNLSAIIGKLSQKITDNKAKLGLTDDVDLNITLKKATIPIVIDYYISKSITTLVSDTVTVLQPRSSLVA